ncbi:MAG: hypothetical protein L6R36_005396 [Xanthoria steineri]|nr:MAG: hypothetical protein L6R36_005396 [Xanthoria steineri]
MATPGNAKGIDNTETELVELQLPDEASTFKKILAEIHQRSQANGVVGPNLGATDLPGPVRNLEKVVRDVLGTVGNGIVHVGSIGHKLKEVDYPQQAKSVLRWSAAHPYQTALQVGMGVLITGPGLLASPALSVAGFTSNGIAAGSMAAAHQAAVGSISSPSTFAMLQSAATGGHAVPFIHGVVRAGSIAASGLGIITTALDSGEIPTFEGTLSADSSENNKCRRPEQRLEEDGLSHNSKSAKERDSMLKTPFGNSKL